MYVQVGVAMIIQIVVIILIRISYIYLELKIQCTFYILHTKYVQYDYVYFSVSGSKMLPYVRNVNCRLRFDFRLKVQFSLCLIQKCWSVDCYSAGVQRMGWIQRALFQEDDKKVGFFIFSVKWSYTQYNFYDFFAVGSIPNFLYLSMLSFPPLLRSEAFFLLDLYFAVRLPWSRLWNWVGRFSFLRSGPAIVNIDFNCFFWLN